MGCSHHKNAANEGVKGGFRGPARGDEAVASRALPVLSYKGSLRRGRCQITGYLLFRFLAVFDGVVAVTAVAASLIACTNASTIGDGFW